MIVEIVNKFLLAPYDDCYNIVCACAVGDSEVTLQDRILGVIWNADASEKITLRVKNNLA